MHVTKRPHKKTRTGCQSCKARRVKCDEVQPRCTSCSVRDLQCNYPTRSISTTSTPDAIGSSHKVERIGTSWSAIRSTASEMVRVNEPMLRTLSPSLSVNTKLHDMRLLHHYSTITIETLGVNLPLSPSAMGVWQREVPRLAFEHTFLMDNLLALASIHMDRMAPESANYQMTAMYQGKALRTYREAVANFSMDIFLPVLITSALLSPLSLFLHRNTDEVRLWTPDWMVMHTGVGTILQAAAWTDVLESSVGPIFQVQLPDPAMTLVPPALQQMLDLIEDDAQITPYRGVLSESVTRLGQVYGGLAQNGVNQAMTIDIMKWPFAIPAKFMELAKHQEPHALIVLAHFIILFELLPQLWWVTDVACHEVETITLLLGAKWEAFLVVPMAAILIKDKNAVLDYLLDQYLDLKPELSAGSEQLCHDTSNGFVALKDIDVNAAYRSEGFIC